MHELGLVYQIVKTVDEIKNEQGLTDISTITLEIGEMSDVVPKFIEEAWQAVKDTVGYGETRMIPLIIPARARCRNCESTELVKNLGFECPNCGSSDFEIISGREFNIKEIVAK